MEDESKGFFDWASGPTKSVEHVCEHMYPLYEKLLASMNGDKLCTLKAIYDIRFTTKDASPMTFSELLYLCYSKSYPVCVRGNESIILKQVAEAVSKHDAYDAQWARDKAATF